MPFPMKVQPIDYKMPEESSRFELVKPVAKSRLKRLFERQFSSVLKISTPDKAPGNGAGTDELHYNKDGSDDFEPSTVCLDKMVQNFIEESNDKQQKCGRNRCNCFNGNGTDSSDDEFGESNHNSSLDACEILKGLVPCASVSERNLLADTAKIIEKNKISKRKDDFCRKTVTDGLIAIGYDASTCKSRWEKKSPSYPSGEYEYVDVIVDGERVVIDIDFRSEFEIARSTKAYKSILQVLPIIFVGKADRLQRIISIVSEAAKQSLKKKGMPCPPWRKAEYVKAKWLSNPIRPAPTAQQTEPPLLLSSDSHAIFSHKSDLKVEDFPEEKDCSKPLVADVFNGSNNSGYYEDKASVVVKQWELPETKPKSSQVGVKVSSGLASVIEN